MSGKIVIGFSPTPPGDDALALGSLLCRLLAADPVVARVVPWPTYLLGDDPVETIERETRGAFEAARDRLAGLDVTERPINDPSIARGLFDVIEESDAEMVVVGSTHRGAVGRMLPGYVAASLLHGAATAVAVAPRGYCEGPAPTLERIGVAFDGSSESREALLAAVALARASGGSIDLIGVSDPNPFGYTATFEIMTAGEAEGMATEHARAALEEGRALVPDGIEVEPHLHRGEPAACLVQASEELDLLVLGSRGYGPVGRTFLGSVSANVTHKAACPVIVAPRGMPAEGIWAPSAQLP
jgi:nucleotide-binding universal stress UspA family protein